MAHRSFTDDKGRQWEVWSVLPTTASFVSHGWLCFETKGEKRRLMQFPETWVTMSDGELCELCTSAEVAPPPRRLLD